VCVCVCVCVCVGVTRWEIEHSLLLMDVCGFVCRRNSGVGRGCFAVWVGGGTINDLHLHLYFGFILHGSKAK